MESCINLTLELGVRGSFRALKKAILVMITTKKCFVEKTFYRELRTWWGAHLLYRTFTFDLKFRCYYFWYFKVIVPQLLHAKRKEEYKKLRYLDYSVLKEWNILVLPRRYRRSKARKPLHQTLRPATNETRFCCFPHEFSKYGLKICCFLIGKLPLIL